MNNINIARSNVRAIQLLLIFGMCFFSYQVFKDYTQIIKKESDHSPTTSSFKKPIKKPIEKTVTEYSDNLTIIEWTDGRTYYGNICSKNWLIMDVDILLFVNTHSSLRFNMPVTDEKIIDNCFKVSSYNSSRSHEALMKLVDGFQEYSPQVRMLDIKPDFDFSSERLNIKFSTNRKVMFSCSDTVLKNHVYSRISAFVKTHANENNLTLKRIKHKTSSEYCVIFLFLKPYPEEAIKSFPDALSKYIKKRIPALEVSDE